jgi:hypothetical protein
VVSPTPSRGEAFRQRVTDDYELQPDDVELLTEAARMLDLLEALHEAVKEDGPLIRDAKGNLVTHPATVEARQVREALRKTLHALGIPDAEGDNVRTRSARNAAERRWGIA